MSLTGAAHGRITAMILDGSLRPGDALQAEKLAERLGMSRTPVREALKRIETEGLAQQQGRFLRVRMFTLEEIEEIFFLRQELEGRAAEVAVALPRARIDEMAARVSAVMAAARPDETLWQVDDDFHAMICGALESRTICTLLADLRLRSSMFDSAQLPARYLAGCQEHLAILRALKERNAPQARALMVTHIQNARDAILARMGELHSRKT